MADWIAFLKERLPMGTYFILTSGFAVSGALLSSKMLFGQKAEINWQRVSLAILGLMLFFIELRLMDEVKDFSKDQIAHPTRPLPRGILAVSQVKTMIRNLLLIMVLIGVYLTRFISNSAGSLFFLLTGYLWLMYREFFSKDWLEKRPAMYAFSHQIVLIPLCFFSAAIQNREGMFSRHTFYYSMLVLGAFFCYELCRKLDPEAHAILKTYLSIYGKTKTALTVIALLIFTSWGAFQLGLQGFLWPLESILAMSLCLTLTYPRYFPFTEAIAGISLMTHIWSISILNLFGDFLPCKF